jgi:hypothetical protein
MCHPEDAFRRGNTSWFADYYESQPAPGLDILPIRSTLPSPHPPKLCRNLYRGSHETGGSSEPLPKGIFKIDVEAFERAVQCRVIALLL